VNDEKTGYVVPARDEVALAGAVVKLLKDNAMRKEMKENEYKRLERDSSWDRIAEKTIHVYKDVLERMNE
jgi:glycosyltransferase involved in cell wall biosynthesis